MRFIVRFTFLRWPEAVRVRYFVKHHSLLDLGAGSYGANGQPASQLTLEECQRVLSRYYEVWCYPPFSDIVILEALCCHKG